MKLINLEDLVKDHESANNSSRKAILEDIFYLCINRDFLETIEQSRQLIIQKLKTLFDSEEIIEIPPSDLDAEDANKWKRALNDVTDFRKKLFEKGWWKWYQNLLSEIRENHKLYGEAFALDVFEDLEFEINLKIEDLKRDKNDYLDNYGARNMKDICKIKKVKNLKELARKDVLSLKFDADMNVLERIIFYNNPFFNTWWYSSSFPERGGYLKIEFDENNQPYIEGKFYIKSTKKDIRDIINSDFPKIEKQREKYFNILKKRDHCKDGLRKTWIAVSTEMEEDKWESPVSLHAAIEEKLSENGFNKYFFGNKREAVRNLLKRAHKESARFNKQE